MVSALQHGAAVEHVLVHESVDHERDNIPGNRRDAGQWRKVMIDVGPGKAYKPLSRGKLSLNGMYPASRQQSIRVYGGDDVTAGLQISSLPGDREALSRFIHDLDPSEAGCDACRGVGTRIVDYDDFRVAARGFNLAENGTETIADAARFVVSGNHEADLH